MSVLRPKPPGAESLEPRLHLHAGEDDHTPAPSLAVVAVDVGGAGSVDSEGQTFAADRGFTGGQVVQLPELVHKTVDDVIYATARQGAEFTFSAKVPDGKYTLQLMFADDGTIARRFSVFAEDHRIVSDWSAAAAAGASTAISRQFNVHVSDGRLSLGFVATRGQAIVSGITLTPGESFFPDPIQWSQIGNLTLRREEAVSFVFEDKLYILGGYIDTPEFHATYRMERFDPSTGSLERLTDTPVKMTHPGVAVDARTRTAWFVGGYIGDFPDEPPGAGPPGTAAVWKYDIDHDQWSRGPSLPAARGAGGAAIVGRKLYFFGGANKDRTEDQSSHWALDLNNPRVWRPRAPLPNPRNHFGTAVVNDRIYVVGGQHLLEVASTNQADVHYYDVTTDTWTAAAPMPRPYSHFTFGMGVFNNRFIVLGGGESPHDVGRPDVYALDTRRNRWGELTALPVDRRAPAGGIINGRLILAGGYDREEGQTTAIWSAELLPAFEI